MVEGLDRGLKFQPDVLLQRIPTNFKMLSLCCVCTGGIQMYGAYGHPLSLTNHPFFVLCICTGGIQTSSKHMGASKHMGVSKHTGGIQHRGHPNIQGIQTYEGVQTYREAYGGHPNIQGPSKHMEDIQTYRGAFKHMGASKCMGTHGHPLSLRKHAFFVLCMYRDIQTYGR